MGERFASVPEALSYTLILLSGDYPLPDWGLWGKVVNFFMVIFAAGICAVPAGVLSGAFVDILGEEKEKQRKIALLEARAEAACELEALEGDRRLGGAAPEAYGGTSDAAATEQPAPTGETNNKLFHLIIMFQEFLGGKSHTKSPTGPTRPETTEFQEWCYDLMEGHLPYSRDYAIFTIGLILANVLAVFLECQPQIGEPAWLISLYAFDVFEYTSVGIFTVDFIMRIAAAPCNHKQDHSVQYYLTSFVGFADMISVVPMYFEAVLDQPRAPIYRVFRLCRLFQLEHFMEAFSLLDDVFVNAMDMLTATGMPVPSAPRPLFPECSGFLNIAFSAPGIIAVIIWVFSATLFYTFEDKYFTAQAPGPNSEWDESGAFNNIPNALYYSAIILGGEWCECDFTLPGKLVAMVVCIVGIALYAIPVGTIFESFGEVLETRAAEKIADQQAQAEEDAERAARRAHQ
jgi:hypothetical protein